MDKTISDKYIGIRSSNNLLASYNPETKKWTLDSKVTQGRSEDGVSWEDKEINTRVVDVDFGKALADVLLTIDLYLQSVNGDLFNEDVAKEGLLQ